MRIPENWLRHFCAPDWSSDELASRLTMAGLEVEERESFAPPFTGVVVAEIVSAEPHPNADKLRVCQVMAGTAEPLEIVCGAPNAVAGIKVPCAMVGARLPGDFEIRPVKMRGVLSNGMLCSARELGISQDHAGLLELPADAAVGQDVRAALELDEQIFTLKLTPNLAHCLSVHGVAREVSALAGIGLTMPSYEPVPVTIDDRLPVTIEAPDLCGRFAGRIIRGVNPGARAPAWMRDRLERAGQRSISALVDISNYVMLELGRPSHVFDLDKIDGGLTVRWARAGEQLELLNGQTIDLTPDFGVIADTARVESLAGIMGGESTSVTDATTDIYLEAAFWWPDAIAGRARRLKFSTDASHRFERGVDPAGCAVDIEYLTALIVAICGGKAGPIDDQSTMTMAPTPVALRFDRARKIIGLPLGNEEIAGVFTRLGMATDVDGNEVTVQVPTYRFDLTIEEDLIEEVARIHGYDRLPLRPPVAPMPMRPAPARRRSVLSIKRAMAARDYQEVISYSFVAGDLDKRLGEHEAIALLNPIARTMDVMRTTLWGGLIQALQANRNRRHARVRIFEEGRVFWRNPAQTGGELAVAGIDQPRCLAMLASGSAQGEQWAEPDRAVDFFDLKLDLEAALPGSRLSFRAAQHPALHPGRSARIALETTGADGGGRDIGWIGELHPQWQQAFELPGRVQLVEVLLEPLLARDEVRFEPVSKYPPSIRDIAVVLDASIPAADVLAEIRSITTSDPLAKAVQNIRLFDEYRGKGLENKEKSLAFRLWMQDTERTLEDDEVARAVERIVAGLKARFDARLR